MSRGRIHPDDITLVRTSVPIEDVVAERVTLRRTGSNLSGLCPFHDDSSPSFTVSPARGLWTCFGCGLGGDVISFVQQAEGLPFVEAVTKLADRAGITLRYLDGDPNYVAPPPGQRARLVALNVAAQEYFANHLNDPDAATGRAYLADRNFDLESWIEFGVGFATRDRALLPHLTSLGFTTDEQVLSGIAGRSEDGRVYERFRGRLTWPIKDLSGDIIGFGARKLFDDDKGPKWLNTPETPLYRKSDVLYGIERARKDIAAKKQVVVVEGYGDVMAAHLAGVTTAVATCGTAFGDGHIKIVRRLLRDDDAYSGRVIFTFDGDAAGQKAALRAFRENNKFTAQTYVAVAPDNMDPCDLRLHKGDQAVQDLVSSAVPLVEFAVRSALTEHDLASTEGRISGLRATAPLVAAIKDPAMRTEYTRRLSGWLALPDHSVRAAVNNAVRAQAPDTAGSHDPHPADEPGDGEPRSWRPDPSDLQLAGEREAAKCLLQGGAAADAWLERLTPEMFSSKAYRGVYSLAVRGHDAEKDPVARLHLIREQAGEDPSVAAFINELSIEPLRAGTADIDVYVADIMSRMIDKHIERDIAVLRSQLADAPADKQADLLTAIMALEAQRRANKRR